jgi:hypothetical protein
MQIRKSHALDRLLAAVDVDPAHMAKSLHMNMLGSVTLVQSAVTFLEDMATLAL